MRSIRLREVHDFLICMDKTVTSEFPGFISNLCRMYSFYRDILENIRKKEELDANVLATV